MAKKFKKLKGEKTGKILFKPKLKLRSQKDLEEYYQKKYKYEKGEYSGYILKGVNFSKRYHNMRHKTAIELLNPKKTDRILDIGCGSGVWTYKIAKKVKEVIGIDIAKAAVNMARKNAPKNCKFIKMEAEYLNFPRDYFDGVYCVEVLEHVLKPNKVLREVKRVLKPGGRLILTNPTYNIAILNRLDIWLGLTPSISTSEHINEWSYDHFVKLISKHGFKLKDKKGVAFYIPQFIRRMFGYKTKKSVKRMLDISLGIQRFPRNSMFVTIRFEKA